MKLKRRNPLRWTATALAAASLALMTSAGVASANGTNGTYQLCSRGTYQAFIQYGGGDVATRPLQPVSGTASSPLKTNTLTSLTPMRSYIAYPGQCVPITLDGSPVDVYLRYDNGGEVKLGTAWWQGNIATAGYKSGPYWYYF
ncbi:hypothetical protein ACIP10_36705 [Streptomyces galbus]|uniref:hypothetical protein n=1 Tax=Streptomyces galbus TaxID=33898 RepID=UPI003802B0E7